MHALIPRLSAAKRMLTTRFFVKLTVYMKDCS
jgi:hypothetical protein